MRRRRVIVVGAVVVVLAALGAFVVRPLLLERGTTTEFTVEDARARYQGSEAIDEVGMPQPGVYVYATTGRDEIDALGGDHHDYPATTTMTVTAWECGAQYRWDVAVERWVEWRRCSAGGAVATQGWTNYDEFFGRGQTDTYECSGDARPLEAAAGTVWRFECVQGGDTDHYEGTVVGEETVAVGGTEVITTHVRVTIDNGNADDTQVTDTWYLRGSDLIVRQSAANDTTNPSMIGPVHYSERYEIVLTDLAPLS